MILYSSHITRQRSGRFTPWTIPWIRSFDLLFRGLEITTGGQRIHDYDAIIKKMEARGMDPEELASYLMIFKYGMPPHGGLGIGLERLTMRLLNEQNVRETTMFFAHCKDEAIAEYVKSLLA